MAENDLDRVAVLAAIGKLAWPHIASFTGSVISLSFVERLTKRGKAFAVFVGFFAASVIGPIIHDVAIHYAPFLTAEVVAPGLNFLIALTFMAALPGVMRVVAAKAGDPAWLDALLKKGGVS
jgi:hypothetical protein